MKLLLDQILSPRLVRTIAYHFPGSVHVREVSLERSTDDAVWEHARSGGFAITTKDVDFQQMSLLRGHPPKVIWIRVGNRPTSFVEELLQRRADDISMFLSDPDASFLSIG